MNCLQHRVHTLSIGVTGTGKTVLINEILSELDETQETIEGKLVRRAKTKMVPDGKRMVIYVDDLNMPKKDVFGSQPPL
jgi:dynein heavy chain